MKKRTIKRWQFLCWQALSRLKRQPGICQRCGKRKESRLLDAHHLIPKSKGNYAKFEPDNIVALCGFYCHRNWIHGTSTWDEERDFIDKVIGLDRYFEMKIKSNFPAKYRESDYERMLEELTSKLEELENKNNV